MKYKSHPTGVVLLDYRYYLVMGCAFSDGKRKLKPGKGEDIHQRILR